MPQARIRLKARHETLEIASLPTGKLRAVTMRPSERHEAGHMVRILQTFALTRPGDGMREDERSTDGRGAYRELDGHRPLPD